MKKKILSVLLALVLALSLSLVAAAPVVAAKGPSLGAVKLPLFERGPGYDPNDAGTGDQAGWAIANTNADGTLIVETHLDNGAPDTTFLVFVKINGVCVPTYPEPAGQLTTNRKGKGNAHVELNIPGGSDTIDVQVVVRVGPPTYLPGYASAQIPVPLKK